MTVPIEVSYRRFDPPPEVRQKIEALLPELDRYEAVITSGRVVVDGGNREGRHTLLEIAVELNVKGGTVVGRRTAEYPSAAGARTFSRAATEAFRVAQGQLRDHMALMRSGQDVGRMAHQLDRGRIQNLDRTEENGFIEMPDGTSLFFSAAVVRSGSFEALGEGDLVRVRVAEEESPYGPQAASVEPEGPEQKDR